MAMRFAAIIIALVFTSTVAAAGDLQFYAGANSTTYDDVPDANTWGVSLRLQYNFSHAESGWFVNVFAPGQSLFSSELSAGYELRSAGDFYWEAGLGAGYSRIWGPFPVVIAGMGYRVSSNVFFDLPIMLSSALTIMPYIGISF